MSTDRKKAGGKREYQGRFARTGLVSLAFMFSYLLLMYFVFPDASVNWVVPMLVAGAVFVFVCIVNFLGFIGYTLGIGGSKDSQQGRDESAGSLPRTEGQKNDK